MREVRQQIVDRDNAERATKQKAFIEGQPTVSPAPAQLTGTTVPARTEPGRGDIPERMYDLSIALLVTCAVIAIGWPIARAIARRIERRGDGPSLNAPAEDQLQRLQHVVDSLSLEVDRLSEEQRFTSQLQASLVTERIGSEEAVHAGLSADKLTV